MTTTQTKNRIPAPLYAAAGAGDLAYKALRDLQAKVIDLGTRRSGDFDIEKLRGTARRNAAAVVAGAQAAQEKAVALYSDLVARGEKVISGSAHLAEEKAGEIAAKADADAKPVKRTRPAVTAASGDSTTK